MSEYVLTVQKQFRNADYEAQMETYRQRHNYMSGEAQPQPTIEERVLSITLTEIEYQAVKRTVLEVWE